MSMLREMKKEKVFCKICDGSAEFWVWLSSMEIIGTVGRHYNLISAHLVELLVQNVAGSGTVVCLFTPVRVRVR